MPTLDLAIGLLALGLVVAAAPAGAQSYTAGGVRAEIIYKILTFADWPVHSRPAEGEPFCLATLGSDPLIASLGSALRDRTLGGRPIRLVTARSADEVLDCQALYFGRLGRDEMEEAFRSLAGRGILTFAQQPDFLARGGMIFLPPPGGEHGIEVHLPNTRQADLHLSSELLRMERVRVVQRPPPS
ncbi:MAG: YfiR family protein [Acidobacteriota bacterium]